MSEFTSEFELFTSVVDPGVDDWSSLDNVLEGGGVTSTWREAAMNLSLPLVPIPGGKPLLPTIVIHNIWIEIYWARGGDVNSNGRIYLREFNIGGGVLDPSINFSSTTTLEPFHSDVVGGDGTFWGCTQQELHDFLNGDASFDFEIDKTGVNGASQTRIAYIRAKAEYTYTGSGIAFPRLF